MGDRGGSVGGEGIKSFEFGHSEDFSDRGVDVAEHHPATVLSSGPLKRDETAKRR